MAMGMIVYLSARESGEQIAQQTDEIWQETVQIPKFFFKKEKRKNLKKVLDKRRKLC